MDNANATKHGVAAVLAAREEAIRLEQQPHSGKTNGVLSGVAAVLAVRDALLALARSGDEQ